LDLIFPSNVLTENLLIRLGLAIGEADVITLTATSLCVGLVLEFLPARAGNR
jgi:hypothetical protein